MAVIGVRRLWYTRVHLTDFGGLIFFLLLLSALAQAATYSCETQFGETVPIRKSTLKAGARCPACHKPGAVIPVELLDSAQSAEWNPQIEKDDSFPSKVKRRAFEANGRQVFLDTRYATQKGGSFRFTLECREKCSAGLLDQSGPISIAPPRGLFDRRPEATHGYMKLWLTERDHPGFLVRIFKHDIPAAGGGSLPVSANGEFKFFHKNPLYIFDVGASEALQIGGDVYAWIAALEVKIRCGAE